MCQMMSREQEGVWDSSAPPGTSEQDCSQSCTCTRGKAWVVGLLAGILAQSFWEFKA